MPGGPASERSATGTHGRGDRSGALAVLLVALGAAWSVGNVGAVVTQLSHDFDISVTTVGLLSGTMMLGFSVVGTILAPLVAERIGIVRTMILSGLLCAAGNIVFAISPVFAGLVIGRVISGLALGLAVVPGPVFARATGGIGRVALFGAAIQLGIAGALGVGAIMVDLGIDWRLTFWLSAAIGLTAIPFLLPRDEISFEAAGGSGFLRLAIRSPSVWRLVTLFVAIFSVPLILGSWLVHYLSVDNGLAAATAGVLSFLLFGLSGAARAAGGTLAQRGVSHALIAGGAPLLAAFGLAILALDDSVGFAALAVVAAGIGFALPYGLAIVEAQRLYPDEPTQPVALVTLVGTAVPVPLVPLIGSLLDDGYGPEVFLGLAAVVVAGGLLNLRPVGGELGPARSAGAGA